MSGKTPCMLTLDGTKPKNMIFQFAQNGKDQVINIYENETAKKIKYIIPLKQAYSEIASYDMTGKTVAIVTCYQVYFISFNAVGDTQSFLEQLNTKSDVYSDKLILDLLNKQIAGLWPYPSPEFA